MVSRCALQPSQALHIALHGRALAADEIVRVGAQAGDGAVPGLAAAPGHPLRIARSLGATRRSRRRDAAGIAARIRGPARRRCRRAIRNRERRSNDAGHAPPPFRTKPFRMSGSAVGRPGFVIMEAICQRAFDGLADVLFRHRVEGLRDLASPRLPPGSITRITVSIPGQPGSVQAISLTAKAVSGDAARTARASPSPARPLPG